MFFSALCVIYKQILCTFYVNTNPVIKLRECIIQEFISSKLSYRKLVKNLLNLQLQVRIL